jgi:uncharacterized protein
MEYTLVLIIHLLCAIIFIGFIFADIFIFPAVKNKFGVETYNNMMSAIISRGIKIYPVIVLILISSGGYMFTKYINSEAGFFNTPFQILLLIKVFLVLLIIFGVIYTMYCKLTKKEPIPFMNHFHLFALILSIFIVIIAKFMFVV